MSWVRKQRNLVDFTLSSLLRRKGKNAALLLVYTLVVFLLASVMFFSHAVRREAALVLREAPDIVVQRMLAGRHDLIPDSYADQFRRIRGVKMARKRLWGYYFDAFSGANFTLMVPEDAPPADGTVTIGNGVAKTRRAVEEDVLAFRTHTGEVKLLKIGKIISSESSLVSNDLVLMAEKDFRELFGIPAGFGTDIVVSAGNPKELATIAGKIAEQFPDARPIMRDEILRTYESVFAWRSGMVIVLLSGALFAFLIFAWDKATGLSAEEKKEISILKAVGWETTDVLFMKFWEGAIVSLVSFLTGTITAYVHVFFSHAAVFGPVLKGWSVLYPEFRLTPFVDFSQLATLFFLTVVPYSVATIIPSWKAATVDPDSVMR